MSKLTLAIVIFTFVVFGIWFLVDLRKTQPSEAVSPELQQALQPLDPNFNQTTLQAIQNMGAIPVGTPRPITAPTATPRSSALPSATPVPPPNINFGSGSATLTQP